MSIFNWFKKNKNDDFVNTNINKADIHSTTISNTDIEKTKKRPEPESVPLENNPDLALKLLNMEDCADTKTSNAEKRILRGIESNCKSWQELLNKAIEICGEPNTAKQRYIYATAYSKSSKEHRRKAIFYLENYLNNSLFERAYYNSTYYEHTLGKARDESFIEQHKKQHMSGLYHCLGELYEKEYDFNNALIAYESCIKLSPTNHHLYGRKVDVLIKMNRIDDALDYLATVKKSKYYKKYKNNYDEDVFMKTINRLVLECNEKKEKGYVYHPRKQKINYVG